MLPFKPFLRWIIIHFLAFSFSPLYFILSGILAGVLLSVEPYLFSVRSPLSSNLMTYYNRSLYLLAPMLTGLLLGAVTSGLQAKLIPGNRLRSFSWILPGALGMSLACMAYAWAYSGQIFSSPWLIASFFSASIYTLACSIPQSRLIKIHYKDAWHWQLFCFLAVMLSIFLVTAPVWLTESPVYYWLLFPITSAGGLVYGFLTGLFFLRRSQLNKT